MIRRTVLFVVLTAEGQPMRKLILDIFVVNMVLGIAALALASPSHAQYVITEIIDSTGDGGGNTLEYPSGVAVDSSGNVHVTGTYSDNTFKITLGGTITEIIDSTGDGGGNALDGPWVVAVDSSGNVYVAGTYSDNVFKIATPGTCSTGGTPCTITEIMDSTGDGAGNTFSSSNGVAVDSSGNVYVTGGVSDNAFKIATPGSCSTTGTPCTITEIIDSTGDGTGNTPDQTEAVAVDSSGNVYLIAPVSINAFKIENPGTCSTGGTPCAITEILDSTGDGGENKLDWLRDLAVDSSGNVYVTAPHRFGYSALKIATPGTCSTGGTPCTISEIIDMAGDGEGNWLYDPHGVAVNSSGNVYVVGRDSANVFKIEPASQVPVLSNRGLAVLAASLLCVVFWVARQRRLVNS